jgi:hypothetical protein
MHLISFLVDGQAGESDFIDELIRQLQKPIMNDTSGSPNGLGHPDLHRMVKEMIRAETQTENKLSFCSSIANVFMKSFEQNINSRAIFILIALIENEKTQSLVLDKTREQQAVIKQLAAKNPTSTGLKILMGKL